MTTTERKPRPRLRAPYAVIQVLGPGLVRLHSDDFGYQLWTRRKKRACAVTCRDCRKPIEKGATCYGEITACAMNRMHRLCAQCLSVQVLRGLPRLKKQNGAASRVDRRPV